MKLTPEQLETFFVTKATVRFGAGEFHRGQLLKEIEQPLRAEGFWEATDDASRPAKSRPNETAGKRMLDRTMQRLKDNGRLLMLGEDRWRVPGTASMPASPVRDRRAETDLVERNPGICGGEAVLRGTRVTLRTILASLAEGNTEAEILGDFPTITAEQLRSVIAFAAAAAFDDLPVPGAAA